ncbi:MAG TPA: GrpB family protein [Tepidiformaceae bacterium]|nr:GrpB family protein [Tepidiformaceae bacterium]
MARRLVLAEPDPTWPARFELEVARIRSGCRLPALKIEHVGSTAVPGLPAKPIIDMVAFVPDFPAGEALIDPLRTLGYVYHGLAGIPGRRYFDLPALGPRELDLFHLHVYPEGHPDASRLLAFRDFLRANGPRREAYAAAKRDLLRRYPEDILLYTGGKTAAIRPIYRAMAGRAEPRVEVVPHDPAWPRAFEAAAADLHQALGDGILGVEHVGSTAVPGLPAKPIIDMMLVVQDFDTARPLVRRIEELGYWYCGENGIPRRHYFIREDEHGAVTHHLHTLEDSGLEARKHRLFRDRLRASPADRDAYGELKLRLAAAHGRDRAAYQEGKTALIERILQDAGWQGEVPSAERRREEHHPAAG